MKFFMPKSNMRGRVSTADKIINNGFKKICL